jgi:hypothetical protein
MKLSALTATLKWGWSDKIKTPAGLRANANAPARLSLDLAGGGHRQRVDELHLAIGCQAHADMILYLPL